MANRLAPFKLRKAYGLVAMVEEIEGLGMAKKFKSSWTMCKTKVFMVPWFHFNSFDISDSTLAISIHILHM